MLSAGFGYITTSEIESSFPKSIAALAVVMVVIAAAPILTV
jgi:hypothetical protein